jgi:DNA-binding NarL/FixJ family response regulator
VRIVSKTRRFIESKSGFDEQGRVTLRIVKEEILTLDEDEIGEITLTRREREVLPLIVSGMANKEIASKLNICERTVKFHVSELLRKSGAGNRNQLTALHAANAEARIM